MSKMVKVVVGILVLIIIAAGVFLYLNPAFFSKYSSPERTMQLLIEAQEKGDAEAYLDCMTQESQQWLRDSLGPNGMETFSNSLKNAAPLEEYSSSDFTTEKEGDTVIMKRKDSEGGLTFKKEKDGWKLDLKGSMERFFQ